MFKVGDKVRISFLTGEYEIIALLGTKRDYAVLSNIETRVTYPTQVYTGALEYSVTEFGITTKKEVFCPYFSAWKNMLKRALSNKEKEKHPTYKDVTICKDWLTFSTFKTWMEDQAWEGMCLDKDILVEYNKEYSPSKCAFVPEFVNKVLLDRKNTRGLYPLGVTYAKKSKRMVNERSKPYCAQISNNILPIGHFLGYYSTPQAAHQAWQSAKSWAIECAVAKWRSEYPESFRADVADSLLCRAWRLRLDSSYGRQTIDLG